MQQEPSEHKRHVRKATLDDAAVIQKFNWSMAKETEDIELPQDVLQRGVQLMLEGKAAGAYYVLEVEGQIIASLMITYEWSDWRAADVWWVQSVYVLPVHRRQGHFSAMYQHVRQEAERQGAAGVRLYADNSNTKAHAVYEKLGMSSHYKVYEDMFTTY